MEYFSPLTVPGVRNTYLHKSENESTMKMDIAYFLENPLGIKKSLGMAKCFALLIELSSL